MIPYFAGALLGYSAFLLLAGVMTWADRHTLDGQPWFVLAMLLVVLPACVQALAGDLTARLLRKRLFDHRAHATYTLMSLGAVVAIAVVLATTFTLPFQDDRFSDAVILAAYGAVISTMAVAFLRRTRSTHCVTCTHDLASAGMPPRCPECGQAVTVSPR